MVFSCTNDYAEETTMDNKFSIIVKEENVEKKEMNSMPSLRWARDFFSIMSADQEKFRDVVEDVCRFANSIETQEGDFDVDTIDFTIGVTAKGEVGLLSLSGSLSSTAVMKVSIKRN